MGGSAVGLGPPGPRPRRTLRALRARRRPADRRRPRGRGIRPPRDGRLGRSPRRHRTLVAVPRRPRRRGSAVVRAGAEGRPVVLYAHSLGGLDRRRLPPRRPTQAGPRGPLVAGARLERCPAGRSGSRRSSPASGPTIAIPNGIDGTTLSRDPSVAAKTVDDPLCVKVSTARFGALALAEQARVRAAAPRGFGIPTLVLHGEDDRLVPAEASAVFAARRWSSDGPTRVSATSSTTSPKGRPSWTRSSPGCDSERPARPQGAPAVAD